LTHSFQERLTQVTLLRQMAQTSIAVELGMRLIRQKQANMDHHLCEKYSDALKQFAIQLYSTSREAYILGPILRSSVSPKNFLDKLLCILPNFGQKTDINLSYHQ
jgi:hypothetical protein